MILIQIFGRMRKIFQNPPLVILLEKSQKVQNEQKKVKKSLFFVRD